jgi:hypothetical protein
MGVVASLTLGGYDTLRFEPHDVKFSLDPVMRIPVVRLRGVTAQVPTIEDAPAKNWSSTAHPLVTMDDSIIAIIDTSTPFLWLPTEVCERFAEALNLKWSEELGVYIFKDGAQYKAWQGDSPLSFTFTLSSYHNADNFGEPLNAPGVVNITFPSAAFAQVLRYPFRNVIQWGETSVPYFPLKRSTPEVNGNQYIIGRAFMQEAYMITSYDRSTFSLHQAKFPENAVKNYSLELITRPSDSPYPKFSPDAEESSSPSRGLNGGQKTGIAIGAFIMGSLIALVAWFFLIRKRKPKSTDKDGQEDEQKDEPQNAVNEKEEEEDDEPKSPVKRMFTKIIRRKRSRKPAATDSEEESGNQPVEVAADEQHQVFEMEVPPEPVELDSRDIGEDDDTDIVVEAGQELTQYEIQRRKLDRMMQGPVPTYTPSPVPIPGVGQEKSAQDVSPVPHYRPSDDPSPASSPTYANSNSIPGTLPSPMTPHGDWNRGFDLPSPMTVMPPSSHLSHRIRPYPRQHHTPPTHRTLTRRRPLQTPALTHLQPLSTPP